MKKVITLWQPWASLIAMNLKGNETRGWAINHRGELYIHAAQKTVPFDELFHNMIAEDRKALYHLLCERYGSYDNLPRGQIIAKTNLYDCQEIIANRPKELIPESGPIAILKNKMIVRSPEYHFGDYTPGRQAWLLKDTEEVEPVAIKGQQGLWAWDGGINA